MVRRTIILMLALVFCMWGFSVWADDDTIIDIDNHIASFTGTWGTNNTPILFYGDDFRWAACSGGDSDGGAITAEAIFGSGFAGVQVDITGQYAVYVRWVVHPNRTDSARYRIYDGATYVGSCTKNQQVRGGEWVWCNTVNMTSGNYAVVQLGNNCEAGKYVVADAVRFVRVSKDSADIVDEPGIDWARNNGALNITSASSSAPNTLISQSITCPRLGYVLAMANGQSNLIANSGISHSYIVYSLSRTTSWDSDYAQTTGTFNYITQGEYMPFSLSRTESCSAGQTMTYYLLAFRGDNAAPDANAVKPTITLLYFPTSY